MRMKLRWAALALTGVVGLVATFAATASQPLYTSDVTDFGRNQYRNHYTPTEPEFPLASDARAIWEVPLGLSRSQPLVVERDFNGDGRLDVRIYHLAGDRLWALDGNKIPTPMAQGQSVDAYRAQLIREGFILWSKPVEDLCSSDLPRKDDLLAQKCAKVGPRKESRPFASSHAAYYKGRSPAEDVIYVGFGHPASVVAIRATTGEMLGGFIIDAGNDRGIVGAPLVFGGDRVVFGTTSGHVYIVTGLANGVASVRTMYMGGRISFSPVPIGDSSFVIGTDARWDSNIGSHGYLMAYNLGTSTVTDFSPRWPAAVITPSGLPGEPAIDSNTVYVADKHGKMYALSLENGQMLWCRQFPTMGPCTSGGNPAPGFINNGPGVDENHVYFVFRNNQGRNQGNGQMVALNKATGQLVWQRPMDARGNTAPVPMNNVVIVGDTSGHVQAFEKATGRRVEYGGYPLLLSDEPYREGDQGERWWEPIGGTATQMVVSRGLMLVGVNSQTEPRTVLKAYQLHRLPDLTFQWIDAPGVAGSGGFDTKVRAICRGCEGPLTTSVAFTVNGRQLPRQRVTFTPDNGYGVTLTFHSGPQTAGTTVNVSATIDPDDVIKESDESNNTIRASVYIQAGSDTGHPDDGWGSRLTH